MVKVVSMNEFGLMLKDGCLLTAGSIDHFNTMTINWGMIGNLWNKEVITCYVRPSRFTKQFLDDSEYFTLSFFFPSQREKLSYLGSVSGKDTDKIKDVGYTPIEVEYGVSFQEAYMTVVCKKIYVSCLDINQIKPDIKNIFYANDDYHYQYVGEIVKIIQNKDV